MFAGYSWQEIAKSEFLHLASSLHKAKGLECLKGKRRWGAIMRREFPAFIGIANALGFEAILFAAILVVWYSVTQ
jgi:hypothetical protein